MGGDFLTGESGEKFFSSRAGLEAFKRSGEGIACVEIV